MTRGDVAVQPGQVAVLEIRRREKAEQDRLVQTGDWREGVRATAERRTPSFYGR